MICQNNKSGCYYNAIGIALDCTDNVNNEVVVYAADSTGATLLAFILRIFGVRLYVRQVREFDEKFTYRVI